MSARVWRMAPLISSAFFSNEVLCFRIGREFCYAAVEAGSLGMADRRARCPSWMPFFDQILSTATETAARSLWRGSFASDRYCARMPSSSTMVSETCCNSPLCVS
jgi:hypothetical protein